MEVNSVFFQILFHRHSPPPPVTYSTFGRTSKKISKKMRLGSGFNDYGNYSGLVVPKKIVELFCETFFIYKKNI
jgi:hypothetical protein